MSEVAGLQFDRAEFKDGPAQAQCAECHRQLTASYYDVDGQTVCEACRYAIESRYAGGSAIGRMMRATGAGLIAALLGAVLYYAIAALTGYEFGLIAIVVGYGVGAAVRWGSRGRGGWSYQTLAMGLTYLAIVITYIPPIVQGLSEAQAAETTVTPSADTGTGPAAAPDTAPAAADATAEPPPETAQMNASPVSPGFVVLVILAIAIAAPFLGGFENIIGLVIIGIGLYEAWKLNRRHQLTITGPHTLARAPQEPAGA
jgi:hypothetical protein